MHKHGSRATRVCQNELDSCRSGDKLWSALDEAVQCGWDGGSVASAGRSAPHDSCHLQPKAPKRQQALTGNLKTGLVANLAQQALTISMKVMHTNTAQLDCSC